MRGRRLQDISQRESPALHDPMNDDADADNDDSRDGPGDSDATTQAICGDVRLVDGRLVVEIEDGDAAPELVFEGEHELGIEDAELDEDISSGLVELGEPAVGIPNDRELFDE